MKLSVCPDGCVKTRYKKLELVTNRKTEDYYISELDELNIDMYLIIKFSFRIIFLIVGMFLAYII